MKTGDKTKFKYSVRLVIDNRLGAKSRYSLREFCVYLVERFSLREREIESIVSLQVGQSFRNEDMEIKRI